MSQILFRDVRLARLQNHEHRMSDDYSMTDLTTFTFSKGINKTDSGGN